MADAKISLLPAAGTLTGDEEIPLVQSSTTKRATADQVSAFIQGIIQPDINDLSASLDERTDTFIRYSGRVTTVGGAATEEFAVVGAKVAMQCFVQIHTVGGAPVSVVSARAGIDKIIVTFSADPSSDHVLMYILTVKL